MKLCLSIIAAVVASTGVVAFSTSPAFVSRGAVAQQTSNTRLYAEEPDDDEEEGGLDLDLGEMFDMYV